MKRFSFSQRVPPFSPCGRRCLSAAKADEGCSSLAELRSGQHLSSGLAYALLRLGHLLPHGKKGTRAFPRSQISDGDPKAGHNGRLFVSFNVSSTIAVFTCCTDSCGSSTPLTNSASDFRSGVTTFRM